MAGWLPGPHHKTLAAFGRKLFNLRQVKQVQHCRSQFSGDVKSRVHLHTTYITKHAGTLVEYAAT